LLIRIRPVFPADFTAQQNAWLDELIASTTPGPVPSGASQGQAQETEQGAGDEFQALARWARLLAQWQAEPAHQGGPSGSKVGAGASS
jgi:hypothetical protein